jgi:hypothetical protein
MKKYQLTRDAILIGAIILVVTLGVTTVARISNSNGKTQISR